MIVALPKDVVVEGAHEELVDQLRHRAAPGTVGQIDAPVPEIEGADVVVTRPLHGSTAAALTSPAATASLKRPYV